MGKNNFIALAVFLPAVAFSTAVLAQDGDRRMRDHDRDRGRGGVSIGTGVDLGIGIGRALTHQPDAEPEVRRVKKRSAKKTDSKSETKLTFVGKPWFVKHNAEQTDGTIGRQADHKSVLVERDGHYLKRSYYAASDGENQKWFWYDTPLEDTNPVIPLLPYAVVCQKENDNCTVKEKKSSDPERLKNHDVVIAGFWEWWNDISGTCKVNAVPEPGSIPATVLINCTAVGVTTPCNGVCKLYTITGDAQSFPKRLPAGNQTAYKCSCESP